MARVQVQSNVALDRVAKLSYRLLGPFVIKEDLQHGAYLVAKSLMILWCNSKISRGRSVFITACYLAC